MDGAGRDENRRAPMYWSDDPDDPDMCAGPPGMDEIQMKFPPLTDQIKDKRSICNWFRDVIRIRNTYPAIARGATEKADSVCDDKTAAFFRRSENEKDLLIVMNLSDQPAEKNLSISAKGFRLTEKLCTNDDNITYKNGSLTMPAYSIAVFTHK